MFTPLKMCLKKRTFFLKVNDLFSEYDKSFRFQFRCFELGAQSEQKYYLVT